MNGDALLVDQGVLDTIENCVFALTGTPQRVLFVTLLPAAFVAKYGRTLARATIFDGVALTLPGSGQAMQVDNPLGLAGFDGFDVVILDRVSNHPTLQVRLEKLWPSQEAMVGAIGASLRPQGRLLILEGARRTAALRRALRSFPFSLIETYCLVPGLTPVCHLVSSQPRAMRSFMLRAHGFTTGLPRNVFQWPRWLAVCLGADRWHVAWYLLHARP